MINPTGASRDQVYSETEDEKPASAQNQRRNLQADCSATLSTSAVADVTYAYDSSATATTMYANSAVFTNSDTANCAVSACTLYASDCAASLPAAISSYVSVDGSFALKVSQTATAGYALTEFCISCTNGA